MSRGPFAFDSSVLVCCLQVGDRRQPAALEMVRRARGGPCILTLQALGEFLHVASRGRLIARVEAAAQVRRWRAAFPPPLVPSAAALDTAAGAAEAGRFGYWDAPMLATAAEAGCEATMSEDMARGAKLNGVRVVPAFAGDAPSPGALALLGGEGGAGPHASL